MPDQLTFDNPVERHSHIVPHASWQPLPGLDAELDPKADHGETTYRGTGRLPGRRALITGGDSGIGAAVAIAFAREGADVAISYLPEEQVDADAIAEVVRAEGRLCVLLPGDIREREVCRQIVADAVEGLGGLDILVNNAGVCEVNGVAECSDEEWTHVVESNLYGAFYGSRAAIPAMKESGGGSIINTASMYAVKGVWGYAAYSASKAGIVGLTKTTAVTYGIDNIRANAICPSAVNTPMLEREIEIFTQNPHFDFDQLVQDQPIRRVAEPEDVAEMVLFLASERSCYTTGAIFPVDGGALA